jgi:tetratricopeptide (TPR) repeat protein
MGLQHPSVAATRNNLAVRYESMGDYEKALQLYQRIENNSKYPK